MIPNPLRNLWTHIGMVGGCLVVLAGCGPTKTWQPPPYVVSPIEQAGLLPSYRELVERYNRNLAGLDRLWARADVTVTYRDDKSRRHSDRADDSNLIVIPPDRVALALGKLGRKALWAGCDSTQYWAFDLRDEGTLYWGMRINRGRPQTQALPSPIYPQELPLMLGLVPIDPDVSSPQGVEWFKGYWLIEPPDVPTRLLIDPATALPVRIDLLDSRGRSVIAARLSAPKVMRCQHESSQTCPQITTRVQAWLLNDEVMVQIKLKDMTDGRSDRRKDRSFHQVFDIETLMEQYKPARKVFLDEVEPKDNQ